jgi:hypothetical protein
MMTLRITGFIGFAHWSEFQITGTQNVLEIGSVSVSR